MWRSKKWNRKSLVKSICWDPICSVFLVFAATRLRRTSSSSSGNEWVSEWPFYLTSHRRWTDALSRKKRTSIPKLKLKPVPEPKSWSNVVLRRPEDLEKGLKPLTQAAMTFEVLSKKPPGRFFYSVWVGRGLVATTFFSNAAADWVVDRLLGDQMKDKSKVADLLKHF